MNTEELIRASVREHTDGMAPPVDVSGLVRRGRRRRVVNLAGTALAVGVLVAGGVVGASALTGGDGSTRGGPEVAGESAGIEGPVALPGPSEVFVMADGRVSLGGVVSDARPRDSLHITRDGVAYSGPGAVPYLLTTDGRDVALAPEQPQRPDSSYTGWVAADPAGEPRRLDRGVAPGCRPGAVRHLGAAGGGAPVSRVRWRRVRRPRRLLPTGRT